MRIIATTPEAEPAAPVRRAFITGNFSLGSKLYSQCLMDMKRVFNHLGCTELLVDDSPAGLLAQKLASGLNYKVMSMSASFAVVQSAVVLVYVQDTDADAHYEERVHAILDSQGDFTTSVYVRTLPTGEDQRGVREPDSDPYGEFKQAFSLIERRIRPVPTRGPQVYRVVEIRPNGGRPWFGTGNDNATWDGGGH